MGRVISFALAISMAHYILSREVSLPKIEERDYATYSAKGNLKALAGDSANGWAWQFNWDSVEDAVGAAVYQCDKSTSKTFSIFAEGQHLCTLYDVDGKRYTPVP